MKVIFKFQAVLVVLVFLLASCSARQGQNQDILYQGETTKEWFDPLGDAEDTVIATQANLSAAEPSIEKPVILDSDTLQGLIYPSSVYRVQVFATQYYYRALEEKQVAAEALAEVATVSYHVPYYRVQVGNARTRAAAEKLLQLARQIGYEQSWIVEEQVDSLFWIRLVTDSTAADTVDVAGQQE